jgi:hypothetical protein
MKKCPVCGAGNADLATVCRSCKGFIQGKVDTIDLFSACWGLVETPGRAFRRIALSRNKNYVTLLSAIIGVAVVYTYFWYWELGSRVPNLITLLGIGAGAGAVFGIALIAVLALVSRIILQVGGADVSFRNCNAVLAYAGMPLVASLFVILPLEIAIFGPYLFDQNPSPMVLNPAVYTALIGLDGIAALWSFVLLTLGIRVASSSSWFMSIVVTLVAGGIVTLLITQLRLV